MPLHHSICVGASPTTSGISNTVQFTSSSGMIQPSSTIQQSSTFSISVSNTQAVSSENDSML